MRKSVALALCSVLMLGLLAGSADAGKKGKKKKKSGPPIIQEIEGSIALPAPFPLDLESGCYAGLHRRASIFSGGQPNGLIAFEFDVDPKTWGHPFALEITGGQGDVDLDLYFYDEFGTPEDVVNDPGGAGQPYSVEHHNRDGVGEEGEVPSDMTKVIVCMMAGGFDATLKYTAGPAAKLP